MGAPPVLPGFRDFCIASAAQGHSSWRAADTAKHPPQFFIKPVPQQPGVHLNLSSRKGRTRGSASDLGRARASPASRPSVWHSKQAQGKPLSLVCPISGMETAHALCKRSTRAQGLCGASGQGCWCTSTLRASHTAGCHTAEPLSKSRLPNFPQSQAGSGQ